MAGRPLRRARRRTGAAGADRDVRAWFARARRGAGQLYNRARGALQSEDDTSRYKPGETTAEWSARLARKKREHYARTGLYSWGAEWGAHPDGEWTRRSSPVGEFASAREALAEAKRIGDGAPVLRLRNATIGKSVRMAELESARARERTIGASRRLARGYRKQKRSTARDRKPSRGGEWNERVLRRLSLSQLAALMTAARVRPKQNRALIGRIHREALRRADVAARLVKLRSPR